MAPTSETPVEEDSFFAAIAERVEERAEEQKDFPIDVPGFDKRGMTVTLTFRPLTSDELGDAQRAAAKRGKKGAALQANTGLIIDACQGVTITLDGHEPRKYRGFDDPDLNKLFRAEEQNATSTVKAVFGLEGFITSTADALIDKSGFANQQIRDQIEGE